MSTPSVAMKPCPLWCTDDPDHDADDVAKGAAGRLHRTASVGAQHAVWDDNPSDPEKAWNFEPHECWIYGATTAEVAEEMRKYAAEILTLADRLGGL